MFITTLSIGNLTQLLFYYMQFSEKFFKAQEIKWLNTTRLEKARQVLETAESVQWEKQEMLDLLERLKSYTKEFGLYS